MEEGKSPAALASELKELVVRYAKQETIDPLKRLLRTVAFGMLGALLTGVGVVFLAVGVLRALQTEAVSTFQGSLSWVPYLIVFLLLAIAGAVSIAGAGGKRS